MSSESERSSGAMTLATKKIVEQRKTERAEKAKLATEIKGMELREAKRLLRDKMRRRLADFCGTAPDVSKNAARSVTQFLLNSEIYKRSSTVLAFVSTEREVDTRLIIERALADKKCVALPRISSREGEMEFYYLDATRPLDAQLVSGSFGILEPRIDAEKIEVKQFPRDALVLVPGLAFSRDGNRLGKGKGFYDKYFSRIYVYDARSARGEKPVFCALCFSCQIVQNVPHDARDMRVAHIASEKEIIACGT